MTQVTKKLTEMAASLGMTMDEFAALSQIQVMALMRERERADDETQPELPVADMATWGDDEDPEDWR